MIADTNYDENLNFFRNLMPVDPQAYYVYSQDEEIDVDGILRARHLGHFEFVACPIGHGDTPSGACCEQ